MNANGIQKMIMQFRNEMNILPSGYDSIQQNPNDERVLIHVIGDSNVSNTSNFKLDIDSNSQFIDPTKNWNADMRFYIKDDYNNIERLTNAIRKLGLGDSEIHKLELRIDELHDSGANSNVNAELRVAGATQQQFQKLAVDFGNAVHSKIASNNEQITNFRSSLDALHQNDSNVMVARINGKPNSPIEVGSNPTLPNGTIQYTFSQITPSNPNPPFKMDLGPGANSRLVVDGDTSDDAELTKAMSSLASADSALRKIQQIQVLNIVNDSEDLRTAQNNEKNAESVVHKIADEMSRMNAMKFDSTSLQFD